MRLLQLLWNNRPTPAMRQGEHALLFPNASLSQLLSPDSTSLITPDLPTLPLADAVFLPPLLPTSKILCVGLNYADHAAEGKQEVPAHPVFFTRYPSSFVGHQQPMLRPTLSEKFDYEAELGVVIGTRCRHVPKEKALDVIFGYTLINDGSIRDYQKRTPQWTLGKNFDASGALGPEIVRADTLPPGAKGLAIRSRLNGQVMQEDNTSNMLFDIPTLIAGLTEVMTLTPGDIISTGTPAGVGFARTPKVWLTPGDSIEVEIEGIGILRNDIRAE